MNFQFGLHTLFQLGDVLQQRPVLLGGSICQSIRTEINRYLNVIVDVADHIHLIIAAASLHPVTVVALF